MKQYSIWVLEYSYVMKFPKSAVLYAAHNQGVLKLPYCYTVIKGNGHVAMFDVGHMNKGFGKEFGESLGVENWHSPHEVLAEIDLKPEDIDTILISHSHFDHFGNVVGTFCIRRCGAEGAKYGLKLWNKVVKTYENVSQFWTWPEQDFLAHPVYSRDYPPLRKC